MLRLGLALLALTAPGAAFAATSGDARLDAFQTACLREPHNLAARTAVVRGDGWKETPDTDNPKLARVMTMARSALEVMDGVMSGTATVWRKDLSGKPYYLVLTDVTMGGARSLSCYFYDFASDAKPIDPTRTRAVAGGAEPSKNMQEAGVIEAYDWPVTAIDGQPVLSSVFLPETSAMAGMFGFSGAFLKITTDAERGS